MNNWKCCLLGDILTLQRGHDLTYRETKSGGIPVVGSNGIIAYHDTPTTKSPCVTIGRSGNIGHAFYYDCDCWAHNTVLYVKDFKGTHPKFAYYLLKSMSFGQYNAGSAVPTLNRNHIHSIEIKYPPLPVQKKIAAILSSLDDKIELNTRMNKVLEEIARALFHRWFVAFEFPNAEGKPYKSAGGKMVESEMGSVPEGWRVGTIGEITKKIFSGGTPNTSKKEYWNGEIPWFSSGETRCHFVIDTEKTITKDGIKNSSTKLAKKHDIVIASAGQGFTRGQTSYLLLDTYVNQSVIVIHSEIPYQIYVYMSISGRYDELRGISDSSSIRGSLTTKMIDKFPIFIPSFTIVEDYAKIIQPIINRIENNLNENKRLTNIRDALLPKLMCGEIEV